MRKPFILLLLPAAAIIVAAYILGAYRAGNEQLAQGQRQLQLMAPELQSVLERFETLPFVLAQQPDLTNALAAPKNPEVIARLNETLQTIQQQAKVGALYLMDRNGLTLGASNWDQPLGFAGKNFSYRPYFQAALNGKAGRFYGIGTSTSEAGYFIAQPVKRHGEIAGVIAVKISLAELERNWNSSEDPIVLADRHGVIFLSNRPNWRYHSLTPLRPDALAELASTQQYIGREVTPLARNPGPRVTQEVGRLGWQLMIFPSQLRVVRSGINWALATALLLACGAVSYWAMHQRRRRREERMAFDRELESRIAQRTQQLSETNRILRTTQNELVQAGKLAMLGQMAAGVTHELNQPLAAIRAFADNARTFLDRGQPEQAASNLGHIGDASARMGAIISQLKGFARKDDTIGPVDFARAVRSSTFLLESESKRRNVAMEIETGAEPLVVAGDTVRIEQVLINILRNALDAVEGTPQPRVSIVLSREGAEGVARISDSGPGIPQEVAAHLFEPFFTTKPAGQGLGLGLAISSSIVQAMNGSLSTRNLDGGGAQFELRLPLIKEGAAR
ncbi:ATP-binding protein [Duganella sp. Root198D2]|uniref:sensor histidine kinase n=1 Tax=Duganella sp. Root198D2 TaxID=1736489 RepID=UPI00070E90D3|nr:ATP-binding protein [Duganella sp. Root198D2]KRB98288.1 C4-dicarboxylate ABC transporter [Duganella sp. Root198D2]